VLDGVAHSFHNAGLSDPRFAGDENFLANGCLRETPAFEQQSHFLSACDHVAKIPPRRLLIFVHDARNTPRL
jgi:hypothetical protein